MSASERALDPIALGVALREATASASEPALEVLRLFDRYQRPLVRYVAAFGLSRPDAEDVVQEVFLALFRHVCRGRSRENLPGWLFRVAHNLALKQRRRRARAWWTLPSGPDTPDRRPDPASNPEEQMADAQQQQRWTRILQALPHRDRQCLLLRAEGLTYREIAAALELSLGTVASTMTRVMRRFLQAEER
jgi:RNA polymerase sigma-70 factor (ECF subfamily)